MISTKCD